MACSKAEATPLLHSQDTVDEEVALLQVRLLACARGVFQATRICIGPLIVFMTTQYNYTHEEKGHILSAFAAGYLLSQVVGGIAADKFGGAPILTLGLASSGVCLLLVPLVADLGVRPLWWLLWIMGLLQGPTYPSQLSTTAKWATGPLRSYASALGGAGSTAGSLTALGATPIMAGRLGWHATAQLFGVATLLFGYLWWSVGRSGPSVNEKKLVTQGIAAPIDWNSKIQDSLQVLLRVPVIVIFFAHAIHNFVRYFLMAWMPTYYAEVLQVSPDSTGMLLILPELCGLLSSIAAAHVGRSMLEQGQITPLGTRRLFSMIAFAGGGLGMVAASMTSSALYATLCLCCVQGASTLQCLGWGANYLDISLHNGGLVTGVGNTVATFASFAAPVYVSWELTSAQSAGEELERWRQVFLAFALANVVGFIVYPTRCSVTPVDSQAGDEEYGDELELLAGCAAGFTSQTRRRKSGSQ